VPEESGQESSVPRVGAAERAGAAESGEDKSAEERSDRRRRCIERSWQRTGGTTRCRRCHSRRNPPRTCSNLLHLHPSAGAMEPAPSAGAAETGARAPARAAPGTNQSVRRKRSGRRPIRPSRSASSTQVCSPHRRYKARARCLDRSLACPAETPNPTTAC